MNTDFQSDAKPDSGDDVTAAKGKAEDDARVSPTESGGGRSEEDRARVSEETVGGNVTEPKGLDFDDDDVFDIGRVELDDDREDEEEDDNSSEAQNESADLLSEFDDYVANEKDETALGTSRALSYGFEVGDLVWGKVKSHPWWPGHIFNEAFATSQVRRTRREGHVLVAFFGDSSYGWFDPAELIPFEPHFAEKSRQTNYRNFPRAVEEAVDELSRRRGLAFVCKCRKGDNFRPTGVPGYFVVDVPDYEHGAVYSTEQIKKARDGFSPVELVSLVKKLASSPVRGDQKSLSFIKNRATMFAYRKAVFEEHDETYAQAFGARSARNAAAVSDQPVKPRAPLSGPLVIAEALGGRKSATKPMKVKDHSKKDKYLFKRRDEASIVKPHQASSSAPSTYLGGSIALGDGDYMLEKRESSGKEPVNINQVPANSSVAGQGVRAGAKLSLKLSLDKETGTLLEVKDALTQNVAVGPTSTGRSDLSGDGTKQCIKDEPSQSLKQEGEDPMEVKYEESADLSGSLDNLQPPLSLPKKVEEGNELNEVRVGHGVGDSSPIVAKSSAGKKAVGGVKKAKVLKRPPGDMNTDTSVMGDKKKKKQKKQLDSETSFRDPQKIVTSRKMKRAAGNPKSAGLASEDEIKAEQQKKDVAFKKAVSESAGILPLLTELEVPQLVGDLRDLALDPSHGHEINSPAIVLQFFLQFRALVYQKSLVLSPPSETELVEGRTPKTLSGVKASETSPPEPVRDAPSSKAAKPMYRSEAAKPLFRSDDRTIAGRKRAPSDRQGEIAAKKSKKMSDIKLLAAERKIGVKSSETQRGEVKETAVPIPQKSLKPGLVRKMDPPSKVVEPTMLVMKFPPKASLPSPAELKAKFARFGPMDQSGLRVFYKSLTCRVVFRYKSDAQAAYKVATSNNSFFGNISVRFHLREVDGPDVPASGKGYGDDYSSETVQGKDSAYMPTTALKQRQQQSLSQSAVQPKSILKKSSGEEPRGQVTGGNGNSKGTARVKFMLGGEEPSRNEQLMMPGNRNNFNNNSASFADDGAPSSSSTTSVAMMNYNARNFQKVNPPPSSLPPLLPLPHTRPPSSQYAKPPPQNNFSQQHLELALPPPPPAAIRNSHNTSATFPSAPTVDISQQMLSLLTRCNDVVSNVKGFLGYVPYHPL
ncbi:PWWP domain-containing protein 1-like [Argentina anserina]|uniref:PWWP domain-containing protein 1-like n=1 Tax=Argentina anserina TaxID=57926 RepID=UPI0021768F49|nr:PWWP domain-containing protein 1-like [Potentilla anserina]